MMDPIEREVVGRKARDFFEGLWGPGDHWDFDTSAYELAKYAHQLALLRGRRYGRVLEIGCGAGQFTRRLARRADRVVALDVAPSAIARARASGAVPGAVDYRVANIMDYDPHAEGPWDLVVMSETVYYLGWLYPAFDLAWLAVQLCESTRRGGRFLMANACGARLGPLHLPALIHTYRDMFLNAGYRREVEQTVRGTKDGVEIEALVSLFVRPLAAEDEDPPA
jgi:SAM-dependent methyltransferase